MLIILVRDLLKAGIKHFLDVSHIIPIISVDNDLSHRNIIYAFRLKIKETAPRNL